MNKGLQISQMVSNYYIFDQLIWKMKTQADQRVQNRIQDHGPPENISHLCLDDIFIETITPGISEKLLGLPNLQFLTLNRCRLTNLSGMPTMENLLAFQAIDNKLTDADIEVIGEKLPNLSVLGLDKNKIRQLNSFKKLQEMEELEHLEVRGNPLCDNQNYQEKLFEILTNLKIIDGQDIFGDSNALNQSETDSEEQSQEEESQNFSQKFEEEKRSMFESEIQFDEQNDNYSQRGKKSKHPNFEE